MRLSIRHKLFLTITIIIVVFIAIVDFLVFGLLDDVVERHVVESIESSVNAYDRFDAARDDILSLQADAMSEVAHLKATLAIDNVDHGTVRHAANSLTDLSEFSLGLILDPDGVVMADVNQMGVSSADVAQQNGFSLALNGALRNSMWVLGDVAYKVALAPIVSGELLLGLVVVGDPIASTDNISALEDLVSVDVGLTVNGEVLHPLEHPGSAVVSRLSVTPASADPALGSGDLVHLDSLAMGAYYSARRPIGATGVITFYTSERSASGSVAAVRNWVWFGTFLSLVLAILASYRLAMRISLPITNLASSARAYGRDQSAALHELEVVGSDEVALLTRSFQSMAEDLDRNQAVLIESKEAAEASSRAKSVFLATMSHEIRTPLNGVIGTASLLARTRLTEKQSEYCSTINKSSNDLLEMLNGVLDYSKADVGQLVLDSTAHSLLGLLSQKLSHYKDAAHAKGISFEARLNVDPDLWVSADATRLHQVLGNLVGNAIKFTDQGQVSLSVDCIGATETEVALRFSVVDTGIGIESSEVERIFESFVQADGAMSRRFGGSGLGLSISQQLVRLMGGSIQVASKPAVGSTFWFSVRFERAAQETDQPPVSNDEPHKLEESKEFVFVGLTALVVEDNEVNQAVAGEWLELLGLTVHFSGNGQEAVERYKADRPDVVFMDCQMPVLDGYAATTLIRDFEEENKLPRTPIIALTANSFAEDKERCRLSGMDEFVCKPFTYEALGHTLCLWFEPQSVRLRTDEPALPVAQSYPSELNDQALEQLRATGGVSLLVRIVQAYLKTTPPIVAELGDALAALDSDAVSNLAHRLKSSSANVGAESLANICSELETAGRAGELNSCTHDADVLDRTFRQVRGVLEALVTQYEPMSEQIEIKASGAKRRVLIVDDDPTFRLALADVLNGAGFSTIQVASGAEALKEAETTRPDIVLMDALMPHMDGFDACRRMQEVAGLSSIPVLMLTGLNNQDSIDRAFDSGAMGFLTKPIQYPVLAHHVRFIIRASENAEQLREHQLRLSVANRMARLGYWIWNSHTDQLTVSPELIAICELTSSEPKSLAELSAFIHEEDRSSFLQDVRKILNDQVPLDSELRLCTASGAQIAINQHVEVSHANAGNGVITATMQDVTKLRNTEDRVRWLAYYDQLTGLANRSYLHEHLGSTIRSARRRKEGFAVLFLDLDGFKLVNDSLGHDQGDEMLKTVAKRLKTSLRENDFLARLGGDEFCMILESVEDEADIALVASRCLTAVEAPLELSSRVVKSQVSIGVARYPSDGDDIHTLLRAADAAMYKAKALGKHRFEFYNEAMTRQASERLAINQELREAVTNEQFELHYQPQVSLTTGRVVRYEALIRWQHPERGLIPPNEFIPELEAIGLIDEVGDWVIQQACHQISSWKAAGLLDACVSVNISPSHFQKPSLITVVQSNLDQFGLEPHCLELEVTESAIQNSDEAIAVFQALNEIGVRLTIDDFGAGYSSLGSLKDLPIHCLKIDRVFIRDLMDNPKDAVLLGTIMTLAHALRFCVVAEGAEHLEQVRILAGLQCDLVQGYFFSRPLPAASIPEIHTRSFLPALESEAGAA